MEEITRQSPVHFDARPVKTERSGDWEIVLEFENEGTGPYIIDLSSNLRLDVQDTDLMRLNQLGYEIPQEPGDCTLKSGILISRLSRNQATFCHLKISDPPASLDHAFTDITDGSALLALIGKEAPQMLEKATALDIRSNLDRSPCVLQGPIFHVPCQVIILGEVENTSVIFIACSRGYAQSMVEGLLDAGNQWHLHPAGRQVFSNWFDKL